MQGRRAPHTKKQKASRNDAVRKIVRSEIDKNQELKLYETILPLTSISATGTIYDLSGGITQGDTNISREGSAVTFKSLLLRYQFIHADSTQLMRVILFRWMSTGVPAVSDIIQDTTINPPLSALSLNNSSYIQVIFDKLHALSTNTNANLAFKKYVKLNGRAQWDSGSSTGRKKGQLFMLFISDSAAVTHPTVNFNARLRFTDA